MRAAILAAALLVSAGCNSEQLRFTTLRLSRTVPELQEWQVIDNLARLAASPSNLPYYTVISTGTANIMDTGSAGLSALSFQPHVGTLGTVNSSLSRAVTGNWTLNPMSNPDRLRAMRAAYQTALGAEFIDPLDMEKLHAVMTGQKLDVQPGWLHVGAKQDVPREACVSGHCGKTYAWVMPEHSREFADFALLMLNIATWTAPPGPNPPLSVSVEKFPPLKIGGPSAPPPAAPGVAPPERAPEAPAIQRRLYEDSQSINRGLFFVPR